MDIGIAVMTSVGIISGTTLFYKTFVSPRINKNNVTIHQDGMLPECKEINKNNTKIVDKNTANIEKLFSIIRGQMQTIITNSQEQRDYAKEQMDSMKELAKTNINYMERSESIKRDLLSRVDIIERKVK